MAKQDIDEQLENLQNELGRLDMTINRLLVERSMIESEIAELLKKSKVLKMLKQQVLLM